MADILTRREARQQARQNRGYNRGQFQLAMATAKNALRDNTDLRGKELRQTARRMVAGVGEYAQSNLPGTFEEFINQPKYIGAPDTGGAILARRAVQRGADKGRRISAIEEPVPTFGGGLMGSAPQTTPTANLTNVGSFDDAFAMARKNGMKVFTWNGKKYGTNTDPNWRERWRRNKQPKAQVSASTGSSSATSGSIVHQAKADNWNVKNLLPEDFYNELNKSIESGIDAEINNAQNADIQSIIDEDNLTPNLQKELKANTFLDKDGNYIGPRWRFVDRNGTGWRVNPLKYYIYNGNAYPLIKNRTFAENEDIKIDPDGKTIYGVRPGWAPGLSKRNGYY